MVGSGAVVVLFTDMVGSTELAMAQAPEAADEARRQHFGLLRQAIAENGGEEVKNLGDGVMVVFGAASAAIACAVTMQQAVDLDNRSRARSTGLRVGISAGEATQEDGDYFGDPVVEAARLCARCDSGQILAADVVRLMAGRRNRHRCTSVGALELKGLPEPLDAVAVEWEPLDDSVPTGVVPLPSRLADRPGTGVVGRVFELGLVEASVKRSEGGGKEVVLLSGEAGLGKTTLLAEAARRAHERGDIVLFGHSEEYLATPYQLFAEALGHLVTHAPEPALRRHVAMHGAELRRLVPTLASRLPEVPPPSSTADSDSERYLLFSAVVGLLRQVAEERPVVLVLDDIQWADEGSLLLLRHIVDADQLRHVAVVAAYRDGLAEFGTPFLDTLAALHRVAGVERLELGGLDESEVVALMEAAAGHELGDDARALARTMHRETDGNAFFVTEILRHLADTGAITLDGTGRWAVEGALGEILLPGSLQEVVASRVGRLGDASARLLTTAAVIGRDFDVDLLASATDATPDEVFDVLDAAGASALVRESVDVIGRYRFAHALIQHALYAALGTARRARLHRRVAVALEELAGGRPGLRIGELARHWGATGLVADGPKAVEYARQAGDAALAALAPADALQHYTAAIDRAAGLPGTDPDLRLDLDIGLGTAQRQTGDPAFRATLLDAAHRAAAVGDTPRLVTAALSNSRGWYSSSGTVDLEKIEVLETALQRLPEPTADRALVMATLCSELSYSRPLDERRQLAEEAVTIARSAGDDATLVRVLNRLVVPLFVPSLLQLQLAWTEEALDLALRLGDPARLYQSALHRSSVATRAGDVAEVDRCFSLMAEPVDRLDQPAINWEHGFHRARRAQVGGDLDEADRLAAEALAYGLESGQPDAEMYFGVQAASVAWQRGTFGDLAPVMEQMVDAFPELGSFRAALALALADCGRQDDALGILREFLAGAHPLQYDDTWLAGMTEYGEAAVICGDPGVAAELIGPLEPWAEQFSTAGGATGEGPVRLVLGGLTAVCGRYPEAEEHFGRSVTWCDRAGARFFGARTRLLWGRMLLARDGPGDRARARDLLEAACATAVEHGYRRVERDARAELESR